MKSLITRTVETIDNYYESNKRRFIFGSIGIIIALLSIWFISSNVVSDKVKTLDLLDRQQFMEDSVTKIVKSRLACEIMPLKEQSQIIDDEILELRNKPRYKALQTQINEINLKEDSILSIIWRNMLFALSSGLLVGLILTVTSKFDFMKLFENNESARKTIIQLIMAIWCVLMISMVWTATRSV